MAEINWLVGWGNLKRYPEESEMPSHVYEALLDNYIRSWLLLTNPQKKGKGHDKYRIQELRIDRLTDNRFSGTVFLYPPVKEGPHPEGKGLKEGFVDHLIPPPPPPPPDEFE